jgi:hypothetical protein
VSKQDTYVSTGYTDEQLASLSLQKTALIARLTDKRSRFFQPLAYRTIGWIDIQPHVRRRAGGLWKPRIDSDKQCNSLPPKRLTRNKTGQIPRRQKLRPIRRLRRCIETILQHSFQRRQLVYIFWVRVVAPTSEASTLKVALTIVGSARIEANVNIGWPPRLSRRANIAFAFYRKLHLVGYKDDSDY